MHDHQLDILGINETRLNKQIDDRDVRVDSYDIYRHDRDASGGGVALYIKKLPAPTIEVMISLTLNWRF